MPKVLFLLAIMIILVPMATPIQSDSVPVDDVLAAYAGVWNRTSDPLDASYLDGGSGGAYPSEDPDDPQFAAYIRGEIPKSNLPQAPIEEGRSYYLFFQSGDLLHSISHGLVQLDSLDHSAVGRLLSTAVYLREGLYTIETDADAQSLGVSVHNGIRSVGYYHYDGGITFRIDRDGTYMLRLGSDEFSCIRFRFVSGEAEALPQMSDTAPYELSTSFHWARAEFDIGPGEYSFSQYTFPAGSDEDRRFRAEVAEPLLTAVPSWADSGLSASIDGAIRMAAYRLTSEESMEIAYYDPRDVTDGHASVSRISAVNPERIGSGCPDHLALFAPSGETVAVAVTYDMSKYSVLLNGGGRSEYLASDSRYEFWFDAGTQLDISVEPLGKAAEGPDRFSAEVLVSTERIPEPDGWTWAFAAGCIGVFALAIVVLIWAGRGPRW